MSRRVRIIELPKMVEPVEILEKRILPVFEKTEEQDYPLFRISVGELADAILHFVLKNSPVKLHFDVHGEYIVISKE